MYKLVKYKKQLFNRLTEGVYKTAPVQCDPASPVVVLSQSYHADMTMYLVAAKSFARFLRPRFFMIVDDGLTDDDRQTLRSHLGDVRFVRSADVDVGACPRRGCWERLASIAKLCQEHYVIQLDSDTVTRSRPDEVLQCVEQGRCFTLGTEQGTAVVSLQAASDFASQFNGSHVQLVAERALKQLPQADRLGYVRGCAGFAGFARGSFDLARMQALSLQMSELVGAEKWREWGSEQFMSNLVLASTPGTVVLPVAAYRNWVPGKDFKVAKFLHFIGDYRFKGWRYIAESRRVIAAVG